MSFCLKKLAGSIVLQYEDGRMSKGLVGEDFRLDFLPAGALLRIDLTNNFELRNRGLYCHRDARIFHRCHARVVRCEIRDRALSAALERLSHPDAWQIELQAKKARFLYAARPPVKASVGIAFSVREVAPPRGPCAMRLQWEMRV